MRLQPGNVSAAAYGITDNLCWTTDNCLRSLRLVWGLTLRGMKIELIPENAGKYEVIVVGGGMSGFCAAIAAAREGAKVLLAEALPYLGGNGVTGIPFIFYRATQSTRLVVGGIALEILRRLEARGALDEKPELNDTLPIDCETLQFLMTRMLDEAGVELLTHSPLLAVEREGRKIRSVCFFNKDRPLRYEADIFIDSSGDAQLAERAGLPTPMGRQSDGKTQPMTLVFTLGGVDGDRIPTLRGMCEVWGRLRKERPNGWRNPRQGPCEPAAIPGKPGVYAFNVTRILVDKGTDSRSLTHAEKEGRYQVEEFVEEFLRPHIPGYEKCYLTQIACRVGVRETRRIEGLYELQKADLIQLTQFPDAIAWNSYPIDIHSPDSGSTQFENHAMPPDSHYTIPFRCLVARDADNLLASGRCLSASHEALSAVRILSAAMATGEAAGAAAAQFVREGARSTHDLDVEKLRSTLIRNGGIL